MGGSVTPPSKRPAGPAARRSRRSRGFIQGLLARGLRVAPDVPSALSLAVLWTGSATAAAGQSLGADYAKLEGVVDLAERCAAGQAGLMSTCREMSLAVMAVQRGVGLASVLGSDIPGTPSTHGRRLGLVPRFGVSVSASALRAGMPNVSGVTPAELTEEQTATFLGLRGTAVAGLLDGFRLAPTLGGILAVDAIGSYSIVNIPGGAGLAGSGSGLGIGARVGLIRESFTLPGISVSASRSWHADIQAGSTADDNPGEATTGLTVSSLRATAGKNWFVIGIMAGVGWDRYEGDVQLSVPRGPGDRGSIVGAVASERVLYFASGWFNFLLTRLSVEAGMAEGATDPFADRSAGFDPAAATWFASAAFRITL